MTAIFLLGLAVVLLIAGILAGYAMRLRAHNTRERRLRERMRELDLRQIPIRDQSPRF
jgi:hypothetical protein